MMGTRQSQYNVPGTLLVGGKKAKEIIVFDPKNRYCRLYVKVKWESVEALVGFPIRY